MKKIVVFFVIAFAFFSNSSFAMSNQELFCQACKSGDCTEVKRTMSLEDVDINLVENNGLITAVKQNKKDIVQLLLSVPSIQINKKDSYGYFAFAYACQLNLLDIAKLFINDNRAELNIINESETPLKLLINYYIEHGGSLELINLMLQNERVDVRSDNIFLHIINYKTKTLNMHMMDILKTLMANQRIYVEKHASEMFHWCCSAGFIEAAKYMIQDNRVCLDGDSEKHFIPIFVAYNNDRFDVVKLLIESNRCNVNILNRERESLFFTACKNNRSLYVDLLISNPRVDVDCVFGSNQLDAFLVACSYGSLEAIKILAKDPRIDINKRNLLINKTPLSCAIYNGTIDIVKFLISDPKCDFYESDEGFLSPIEMAITKKFSYIIECMLKDSKFSIDKIQEKYKQSFLDFIKRAKLRHLLCNDELKNNKSITLK